MTVYLILSYPNIECWNTLIFGVFWTKFEHFLKKIRIPNFDCCASRGRAENFSAQARREEKGVWGKCLEGVIATPRGKNSRPALAFPPP